MLLFLLLAAGVHTGQSLCANARTVLGEVTNTDSWGTAPQTHVYVSRPSPAILELVLECLRFHVTMGVYCGEV